MSLERVTSLPVSVLQTWTAPAVCRLLRVVTGDDRHLEEPVAWLAARGAPMVYDGGYAVVLPDGAKVFALGHFRDAVCEAWRGWLVERGWEREDAHEFDRVVPMLRSPSGRAYVWDPQAERPCEALAIALFRERIDVAAEMARGAKIVDRIIERWVNEAPEEVPAVLAARLPTRVL